MKNLLYALTLLFLVLLTSCDKEDDVLEEYVGIFNDEYLASIPVETENRDAAIATVDAIARQIFAENGAEADRPLTIYYFGSEYTYYFGSECTFTFVATLTAQEADRIKGDNRIREMSKTYEFKTDE